MFARLRVAMSRQGYLVANVALSRISIRYPEGKRPVHHHSAYESGKQASMGKAMGYCRSIP